MGADLIVHLANITRLHGWQDEARSVAEHVVQAFLSQLKLTASP